MLSMAYKHRVSGAPVTCKCLTSCLSRDFRRRPCTQIWGNKDSSGERNLIRYGLLATWAAHCEIIAGDIGLYAAVVSVPTRHVMSRSRSILSCIKTSDARPLSTSWRKFCGLRSLIRLWTYADFDRLRTSWSENPSTVHWAPLQWTRYKKVAAYQLRLQNSCLKIRFTTNTKSLFEMLHSKVLYSTVFQVQHLIEHTRRPIMY